MKKRDLIIYRVATIIFSLMMVAGAMAYFVKYDMTSEMFSSLGVPTEIIYPLAILKILGAIALLFVKNPLIKNLAYLGFGLDLTLAILAHLNAGDGGAYGPVIPLLVLAVSYWFYRRSTTPSVEAAS